MRWVQYGPLMVGVEEVMTQNSQVRVDLGHFQGHVDEVAHKVVTVELWADLRQSSPLLSLRSPFSDWSMGKEMATKTSPKEWS